MKRREFTALLGTGMTASLAGCLPDVQTVDDLERPVIGDPESDVVLRVFEDLGCPACRRYEQGPFQSLKEEYIETEKIRYEFYDYVIPANPNWSQFLANAARGVQDRVGNDAFWNFTSEIFDNQRNLSNSVIRSAGENAGVEDIDEWENDAQGGVYDPVISDDAKFGENEYNVSATPTLVLNDTVLSNAATGDFTVLQSSIEQVLNN